ncbi:MAG: hypothetical protein CL674_14520 [Bdellovibrionaceae bacterium]|jgi:peptidoglycan hydrolase CwlO-like protein|nr:hypothetical protein [Pseudobdellovibrionaceae bacterium]MAF92481.1 hypothetical protein [Pseudobdellovibrionaceae bacterium]QDP47573.1 MAG: hypothetical protein GOVbin1174_21 [Prokaryotic dsDNA virus sp.]|tara:strand:+ start:25823 stop:26155 length:333 start_codon:yes stop_codon:yes gene_type:complete
MNGLEQIEKIEQVANLDLSNIYITVGVLIFMNLGAIGTGIIFLVRLVWIASKYDSKMEKVEKDLNNAFEKIKEKNTKIEEVLEVVRSFNLDLELTKQKVSTLQSEIGMLE